MKNTQLDMQAKLFEQATYFNGYSAFLPASKSIAFKVHSVRLQEPNIFSSSADNFILNLGFERNDIESEQSIQSFLAPIGTVMLSFANQEDNDYIPKINLPASVPLKMALDDVVKTRRSIRHYTGDKVSLTYLATVLRVSQGITTTTEANLYNGATTTLHFRTVGSAGGIYPIDIYIAALNVEKLEKAIYQYNSPDDCLVKIYDHTIVEKLLNNFLTTENQISIQRAGFICLLIGTASKSISKYGNQGLSFALQEIGSISQNIHLAVTALGLGSVDCASFFSSEAHQNLQIDGLYKRLFHTIVVGVWQ